MNFKKIMEDEIIKDLSLKMINSTANKENSNEN